MSRLKASSPRAGGLSVRPFEEQGHFTTMHNLLLDVVMPRVSDPAWKVLCFVVRHTVGYHKRSEEIPYPEIMAGTGIASRTTVARALAELLNEPHGKGKYLQEGNAFGAPILLRRQGKGPRDATRYALNRQFELRLQRGQWSSEHAIEAASGEGGSPQSVPRKGRFRSPQDGLPDECRSPQSVPTGRPQDGRHTADAYKDRAHGKESTKKVLPPGEENGGGGGLALEVPPEHEESGPPPPRASSDSPIPSNLTGLEPAPLDELALALCEVCGVCPTRPSAVDLDRWPGALERVRALAEQHAAGQEAAGREALLAFRAWWFATPTASGARRQSLYLSNVASHLGQFLQARQSAAENGGGLGQGVAPAETPRERKRRERLEIERRGAERRAEREKERRVEQHAAEGVGDGESQGGAR